MQTNRRHSINKSSRGDHGAQFFGSSGFGAQSVGGYEDEFAVALGGTGGDGAFKIAVVDAGGESTHELWQIRRRAKDAPRIIGTCIRGDGGARASILGELIKILSAAGKNTKHVRFFADDGEETELSAEPHE